MATVYSKSQKTFVYDPGSPDWIKDGVRRAKLKDRFKAPLEEPFPGIKGLYLASYGSGGQSWRLRHKGKSLTLGSADLDRKLEAGEEPEFGSGLTKDMAAWLGAWCRMQIDTGRDPKAIQDRRDQEMSMLKQETWDGHTFDSLAVKFLEHYPLIRGRKPRQSSIVATAGHLGFKWDKKTCKWMPTGNGVLKHWQGKIFSKRDGSPVISKSDAYEILEGKSDTPITANRTQSALRLFGSWVEDRGYVSVNPFATLKRLYPAKQRYRILTDDEIRALWHVVETAKAREVIGYPYGKAAQLQLMLGLRPGEVRLAAWSEFDFAEREWTVPPGSDETQRKSSESHVVPLPQMALELLASLPVRGPYLFMAEGSHNPVHKQSRVSARLLQRVGKAVGRDYASEPDATKENPYLGSWKLHDFRHTAFSGMTAAGVPGWLANKATGHADAGMQKVYDQYDYRAEKFDALQKWERRLRAIIAKA